jgi:hypothetical protein
VPAVVEFEGQAVHASAPPSEYVPTWQTLHSALSASKKKPAPHEHCETFWLSAGDVEFSGHAVWPP